MLSTAFPATALLPWGRSVRIPSSPVGMKEPQTREGCWLKVTVKFSIWTAGHETTWGTEKSPAGLPSTERHLLYNHWWKEMAYCCHLSLLGHSVPFSLLHVSLLTVIGAHSVFWKPLQKPILLLPSLRCLGWTTFPYSEFTKWQGKEFQSLAEPSWNCWKLKLYDQALSHESDRPLLHQQNLFLCGLLFARRWHFHLEDELILSRAKSPLSLRRMLGLGPSQDPGAVRPNPIPMWWWVSLP